jgi:hypothetical protein
MYGLLTGLVPHYGHDTAEVQDLVKEGKVMPYISNRFRNGTVGEKRLSELIDECWIFDPDKRIDVFSLVRRLRDALDEHTRSVSSQ